VQRLATQLFVAAYFFSVISSTQVLKDSYEWFYYAKHLSVLILAVLGLSLIRARIERSQFYGVLSLLVLIFPFLFQGGEGILVLVQYLGLYIAALALSTIWQLEISRKILIAFLFIAITPILFDLLLGGGFIYNSFYGRDRLLLGYFHPKEGAIALLIPILLINLRNKELRTSLSLLSLFLLFFMQSRNALLFYLNFIILSYGLRKFGLKATLVIFTFFFVMLPIAFLVFNYDTMDVLLSNRLSIWNAGNITWFGSGTSIASFEETGTMVKFHIDNFYLEYLIENGVLPFLWLVVALSYFVKTVGMRKINGIYVNSLFIPFLFYCFFDAGMFSSGNFLNLFIWSLVICVLSKPQGITICCDERILAPKPL
jgi:hypothetical protein